MMNSDLVQSITLDVIKKQDENECWNVLNKSDKYYPEFNYYVPNYKSTLWTLIFLADIQCDANINNFSKPLEIISNHFLNKEHNIYSIGKSHFPIPCLNGNLLYLQSYFNYQNSSVTSKMIDFFAEYQRFDDGDYKTPSSFPYFSNRSCYGKHTCFWGIVKLLKGLSFIPKEKRTSNAKILLDKCIDFILLHNVCYSSHNKSDFLHTNIKKLTFPNMYQSDFLEILWLLKREKIQSNEMNDALVLLRSKMDSDSSWKIERQIKNLIIPFGKKNGSLFVTQRAREVLDYYEY